MQVHVPAEVHFWCHMGRRTRLHTLDRPLLLLKGLHEAEVNDLHSLVLWAIQDVLKLQVAMRKSETVHTAYTVQDFRKNDECISKRQVVCLHVVTKVTSGGNELECHRVELIGIELVHKADNVFLTVF